MEMKKEETERNKTINEYASLDNLTVKEKEKSTDKDEISSILNKKREISDAESCFTSKESKEMKDKSIIKKPKNSKKALHKEKEKEKDSHSNSDNKSVKESNDYYLYSFSEDIQITNKKTKIYAIDKPKIAEILCKYYENLNHNSSSCENSESRTDYSPKEKTNNYHPEMIRSEECTNGIGNNYSQEKAELPLKENEMEKQSEYEPIKCIINENYTLQQQVPKQFLRRRICSHLYKLLSKVASRLLNEKELKKLILIFEMKARQQDPNMGDLYKKTISGFFDKVRELFSGPCEMRA